MKQIFWAVLGSLGLVLSGCDGHSAADILPEFVGETVSTPVSELTVADISGEWVEPETNTTEPGLKSFSSENNVEIENDGSFRDDLDVRFEFPTDPDLDGTYRIRSQGAVSIDAGLMTWEVTSAQVDPDIPASASPTKREAMLYLAGQIETNMVGADTYEILRYSGRKLVMRAGDDSSFDEYEMVRR